MSSAQYTGYRSSGRWGRWQLAIGFDSATLERLAFVDSSVIPAVGGPFVMRLTDIMGSLSDATRHDIHGRTLR